LLNLTGFVEPYGSSGSVQPSFDALVCVNIFGLFGRSKFSYKMHGHTYTYYLYVRKPGSACFYLCLLGYCWPSCSVVLHWWYCFYGRLLSELPV